MNLLEKISEKNLSPENLSSNMSTKNNPKIIFRQKNGKNYRTKNCEEKPLPKRFSRNIFPAKKKSEEKIQTKNLWRNFLYQNEKNYPPQKPLKTFGEKSLPFFGEKPLPNKFQKKPLPKNLSRTMSAKNNPKRNLYEKKYLNGNFSKKSKMQSE